MPQLSAIDLLVTGKTDKETAELLSLSRTCITKWRLYDPVFQAALNRRRAEVWASGIDRLRALIPQALKALAEALESRHPPAKFRAACAVLGLVKLPAPVPSGLTSADDIVTALVQARMAAKRAERDKYLSDTDRLMGSLRSPTKEQFEAEEREARAEVLAELEAKLNEAEEAPP
jgi:hypothetical protein